MNVESFFYDEAQLSLDKLFVYTQKATLNREQNNINLYLPKGFIDFFLEEEGEEKKRCLIIKNFELSSQLRIFREYSIPTLEQYNKSNIFKLPSDAVSFEMLDRSFFEREIFRLENLVTYHGIRLSSDFYPKHLIYSPSSNETRIIPCANFLIKSKTMQNIYSDLLN